MPPMPNPEPTVGIARLFAYDLSKGDTEISRRHPRDVHVQGGTSNDLTKSARNPLCSPSPTTLPTSIV